MLSKASDLIPIYRSSIARWSWTTSVNCFSHAGSAASGSASNTRASLRAPCGPLMPSTTHISVSHGWLGERALRTCYPGDGVLRLQPSQGQLQLAQAGIDRGIFLQTTQRIMEVLRCKRYMLCSIDNADGGYRGRPSVAGLAMLGRRPL